MDKNTDSAALLQFAEEKCSWWELYSDADCLKVEEKLDLAASEATTIALGLALFVALGVFSWLYLTRVKKRGG